LNGTLEVLNGHFAHITMPLIIAQIQAKMKWADHRLTWNEAHATIGSDRVITGPCEIDLSGDVPLLNFKGRTDSFNINQWLMNWGKLERRRGARRSDDPSTRTLFQLTCDVEANNAQVYKHSFGDFSGSLKYRRIRRSPNILTFQARSDDAFKGRATVDGRYTIGGGQPGRYSLDIDVENASVSEYLKDISPNRSSIVGLLSGNAIFTAEVNTTGSLAGRGNFNIEKTEFLQFPLFDNLADLTGMMKFREASFSRIQGHFFVENRVIYFPEINFDNPFVKMTASGTVGFDETLNLEMRLSYFESLAPKTPWLGKMLSAVDRLVGSTFSYSITGTLKKPEIKLANPFGT
jgi:hypothetical protein